MAIQLGQDKAKLLCIQKYFFIVNVESLRVDLGVAEREKERNDEV